MNDFDEILLIPVEKLLLDEKNPRLPERLREKPQSEMLQYLYNHAVLDELAQSYLDNDFFPHEPLIVIPNGDDERYVVIEGNRRLAALKVLHRSPEADGLRFITIDPPDPSEEDLERLREIPCCLISNRNAVHAYLGFRHIGALKTWPPEAKARYILTEARRLVDEKKVDDPFRALGRRVGSNAQGMRNPYLAIRILLHARDEFGSDVNFVQESRFGVWLRCMNSSDIRKYIGLGNATTYQEIEQALAGIRKKNLEEVLGDLEIKPGERRAVLGDSREVTVYGRALTDERAHETLRRTKDLGLVKQIIEELELDVQARLLADRVRLFMETLSRTKPADIADISNDLLSATEELALAANSVKSLVKGQMDNRDSES